MPESRRIGGGLRTRLVDHAKVKGDALGRETILN